MVFAQPKFPEKKFETESYRKQKGFIMFYFQPENEVILRITYRSTINFDFDFDT